MLNRNSVRAAVAAIAILFSAAFSDNAVAQPFADGDFITYSQGSWGDTPSPTNAAGLLLDNYTPVYSSTGGVVEVGILGPSGFSTLFSNVTSLLTYLPALGPIGPLTSDFFNPTATMSGAFGGDVMALRLNIDFSDAGLILGNLGIPFGDLELHSFNTLPLLNGLTVRQFSDEVETLLGGGSSLYSLAQMSVVTEGMNTSFLGGSVGDFAEDHLRVGPFFSDGDFITHPQASWGANPAPTNPAGVLQANYNTVYAGTGGVFTVGRAGAIHYSMQFNNADAMLNYLPAFGTDGRLLEDYLNPLTTHAGGFGGEVSALKLNIDFSDAGLTQGTVGTRIGDLELYGLTETNQTQFNGSSVRQFFAAASFSLGTAVAADVSHFNAIAEQLNAAFADGDVTAWARNHLRFAALLGDYNGNNEIDAADYTVWRDALTAGSTSLVNDPTPGVVDESDFLYWRDHYGESQGGGAGSAAAVPEPAGAALVLVGLLGLSWCGKRRSNPC